MKKLFFIAAMVTLAACSNETSTTSIDSTAVDTTNVDSLIESSEAHADSLHAEIETLKK
jgi:peptidoglycan hydrolase CwlO-like protein